MGWGSEGVNAVLKKHIFMLNPLWGASPHCLQSLCVKGSPFKASDIRFVYQCMEFHQLRSGRGHC